MKYRICKNGNGEYKVQSRIFFIWWNELGPKWFIRIFVVKRHAEEYIQKLRNEKESRKNWICEGEY
jgi:hypothetical protein